MLHMLRPEPLPPGVDPPRPISVTFIPASVFDNPALLRVNPEYLAWLGWLDHFIFNEYYKTEEEFLFALADALREESLAVVGAGFVLQIDDPGLPDWWDMLKPEPTIEAYRKFAELRIDAVNRALVGIPEERVRYHLCWGSWHGPHTHDLPLEHIIDLILEVKAQTGFVRFTGWLGSEVAGRLARWLKSHTAATAFRRLSSSMLCGSTCASR